MSTLWRLVGVAALGIIVIGLAFALASSQAASRDDLNQRLAARTELSRRFASSYTTDVLTRERNVAEQHLASPAVTAEEFARVTSDLGFEAAVLLDDGGRLLQVVPANPSILGRSLIQRYAHLATAVNGHTAISGVVPGAATGQPVVGFATPFDSAVGRRVFSGAFDVGRTPLGTYLDVSLPYRGAIADVVDAAGLIVASSRQNAAGSHLSSKDPALARAVIGHDSGSFTDGGQRRRFVVVHPQGTPWTLINSVPESSLYSTLGTTSIVLPWIVLGGLGLAGGLILVLVIRLGESRTLLSQASLTDPLTGLPNRRAWDSFAPKELRRAARIRVPVWVGVMDIDHFKDFNDQHGHATGDALLVSAATAWSSQLRAGDLLARLGGEEFGFVLPAASAADARLAIERLRSAAPNGSTASAGCVEWDGTETISAALERADRCLYEAKGAGRNRLVMAARESLGVASARSSLPER